MRRTFLPSLLRRLAADRTGSYAILAAFAAPATIGFVGLGTEDGLWLYTHQSEQSAADAAAFSAAENYGMNGAGGSQSTSITTEGKAVAASYGFVNGQNDTTVTVNRPALSGPNAGKANAVEVIVTQKQPRMFSALFRNDKATITARSVALGGSSAGCVLALDQTMSDAFLVSGGVTINLTNCDLDDNSNNSTKAAEATGGAVVNARKVSVVGGINGTSSFHTTVGALTSQAAVSDPYASVNIPSFSGCDHTSYTTSAAVTINPGVYCNGLTLTSPANVTMNAGVYYVDRGTFSVSGGSSVHGTGVTIVLTSSTGSNYATSSISGSSTVNLTAPSSGTFSGMVFFGDRRAPVGTKYVFSGGTTQTIGGALYFPKGAITWSGGSSASSGCTQIIGDSINFSGSSNLALNCSGYGVASIGSGTMLTE